MSLMDAEAMCIERLKQAVEGDPLAEALALMTTAFPEETERFFFERLLPYAVDKTEPFTVADVCCGSGVMLLAAARQFPRWAIDSGLVQFYGVDIDPLCVEMCRLNILNTTKALFEERVTKAEALARGLGLQRLTVGPIEWWFDDEGNFCWRRLETPQVDGWEQGRLPGCDIDNE